ncbi:MAG: sugar phosphate isomerase/epimerase [Treponema sp.]|jgi:sugar phosphate isomerase/epimerase|nr:sugar phosphate isomerase/epimerase [Treponema sp.]
MLKIFCSELILLGKPVLQNVQDLMNIGCNNIELMQDGEGWDDIDGLWEHLVAELPKLGIAFTVHPAAWDINLTSPIKELRDAAFLLHEKSIRFAHRIGASQVVLHPGFSGSKSFDKARARRIAGETAERLAAIAKPLGLRLAFENVGYHGSSIYTAGEYCHALDGMDDTLGYLLDTGHAHLNGWDSAGIIERLKNRLYGIHIHDNMADTDSHLPINDGSMDWKRIFAAMRSITGDCDLVLEYGPGIPVSRLREGFYILIKEVLSRIK